MAAKPPHTANPQPSPAAVSPAPVLTSSENQALAVTSGSDKTIGAPGVYTTATGLTVTTLGYEPD